jgi:hypothetical protein
MASQQIAVPEHLKKYLTNTQQSGDTDAMAAASISIPRISLKGRKFRLIEGGEEIRKPAEEFFGVILAVEPGAGLMAKTFYKEAYQSGDSKPPDCSSANGVTPDPWISEPQNDRCATCPNNRFGSAKTRSGGKGKACKDSKRLWVAEPDKIGGTVYALGIPVTSLKPMSEYGAMLKANGVPSASVITRFTMKDSEFPELIFEFVGVLEEEVMEKAMLRNEKKDWDLKVSGPLLEHQGNAGPIAAPGQPVDSQKLLDNANDQAAAAGAGAGERMSADQAASSW